MDRPTNITLLIEKRRLGYVLPKQIDLAFTKLKCLADDLNFFYDSNNERVFSPAFVCKFCPLPKYENLLISANEEGKITLISAGDNEASKTLATFQGHNNAIFDLTWSGHEAKFLSAAGDQSAHLWQIRQSDIHSVNQFLGHTHSVKAISCNPDDPCVFATGGRDGSLIVWDSRMQNSALDLAPPAVEPYKLINHSHEDPSYFTKYKKGGAQSNSVTGLVYQNGNNLISCSAGDGLIKVWDMRKSYQIKKRLPSPKHCLHYGGRGKNGFSYLAISPDRLRLYANCIDWIVYCYDIGTYQEKPIAEYRQPSDGPLTLSFYIKNCVSPDGRYIATGSTESRAFIWSVRQPAVPLVSLCGHAAEVTCVDFSKAGLLKIGTCSDDTTVRVWRTHPQEMTDNDPSLRGTVEYYPPPAVPQQRTAKRFTRPVHIKKYFPNVFKTPPKQISPQKENLSPGNSPLRKKLCRRSSFDLSSITENLPNFVLDGRSPHLHRCSQTPKPQPQDWLSQLSREKSAAASSTPPPLPPAGAGAASSGSKPMAATGRRRSSATGRSSSARANLLKFFPKVSSSQSTEQQSHNSTPTDNGNTK